MNGRPETIEVVPHGTANGGWRFGITVTRNGMYSKHEANLSRSDYERLCGGRIAPTDLARSSIEFLVATAPESPIPRSFKLTDIARTYPEYPYEMHPSKLPSALGYGDDD